MSLLDFNHLRIEGQDECGEFAKENLNSFRLLFPVSVSPIHRRSYDDRNAANKDDPSSHLWKVTQGNSTCCHERYSNHSSRYPGVYVGPLCVSGSHLSDFSHDLSMNEILMLLRPVPIGTHLPTIRVPSPRPFLMGEVWNERGRRGRVPAPSQTFFF